MKKNQFEELKVLSKNGTWKYRDVVYIGDGYILDRNGNKYEGTIYEPPSMKAFSNDLEIDFLKDYWFRLKNKSYFLMRCSEVDLKRNTLLIGNTIYDFKCLFEEMEYFIGGFWQTIGENR